MSRLPLHPSVVRRNVLVRGGPLALLEVDPGQDRRGTLLLVPGYTGSKEDFRLVMPLLAEQGWQAVSVDQRGQYESPGPEGAAAYAVDELARDVVELAALLGPVHLVGHSFGGLVTRAAVLQDTGRFLSHVLMDSGPARLTGPRSQVMGLLRPVLEQGGLPAVWQAMQTLGAQDPRRVQVSAELEDFLQARLMGGSQAALLAMGDALLTEPDRVAELAATGLRTLVLYGEADDAWLPQAQAAMAVRLGADVVVVPGALHSPAVEQPAATAAALLEFVSRP